MLLGCCHCGPLDSVSSVFASSHESLSQSDSLNVGSGCFCIGSVSSNTWRMDIDYGWAAPQGLSIWCGAIYRKYKSYILRRVSSINSVCYWYSDERCGRALNNPYDCAFDATEPRAWMAIHGPNAGYTNRFFPNGWAMSAGLFFRGNQIGTNSTVLPYVYKDPNGNGPFGLAKPGSPINCLTPKTLVNYTELLVPNNRRWYGPSTMGVTQFPATDGFGTTANNLIPVNITLTPVNA